MYCRCSQIRVPASIASEGRRESCEMAGTAVEGKPAMPFYSCVELHASLGSVPVVCLVQIAVPRLGRGGYSL